jgi:hypothetical protein
VCISSGVFRERQFWHLQLFLFPQAFRGLDVLDTGLGRGEQKVFEILICMGLYFHPFPSVLTCILFHTGFDRIGGYGERTRGRSVVGHFEDALYAMT